MKGKDQADKLVGKTTLTSGLLLGRSEVLRSLRHYTCRHKAKDVTPSVAWMMERAVKRGSAARRSSLLKRAREGHHQSDKHWNHFKGSVGETSETGRGGAHNL